MDEVNIWYALITTNGQIKEAVKYQGNSVACRGMWSKCLVGHTS
jgi:hypothetical protein